MSTKTATETNKNISMNFSFDPSLNVDIRQKVIAFMREKDPTWMPPTKEAYKIEKMPNKYVNITMIPVDKIIVRLDSQRPRGNCINDTRIQSIINEFDWNKFDPLKVVLYNGQYICIDGQGRLIGLVFHPSIKEVPCIVQIEDDASKILDAYQHSHDSKLSTPITHADDLCTMYACKEENAIRLVDFIKSMAWKFDQDCSSKKNDAMIWDKRCTTQLCYPTRLHPAKKETYNFNKITDYVSFYCAFSAIYFNGEYVQQWWSFMEFLFRAINILKNKQCCDTIKNEITPLSLFDGRIEYNEDGSVAAYSRIPLDDETKKDFNQSKKRIAAGKRAEKAIKIIAGKLRQNQVCSSLGSKSIWHKRITVVDKNGNEKQPRLIDELLSIIHNLNENEM